jgi:hypothetical protein
MELRYISFGRQRAAIRLEPGTMPAPFHRW